MSRPSLFTLDQVGIGEILKHNRLKVPPHQRDYSWTKEEVGTLFTDLQDAIADKNNQAYFLGTIVTIRDEQGILEIIDGQQRLATITILLCNIKRYLMAMGTETEMVDDLHNFLNYTDRAQRAKYNRLRMNLVDNEYFSALLDDRLINPPKPKGRSTKLIKAAFDNASNYVKKIVDPYNPKMHGDVLNNWITFIERQAEVILLQVPSASNAYRMFETLNDRGLKTTQADLVKNYLFGQAGESHFAEVQDSWSAMRGILELLQKEDKEDITVNYLRQALMVIRGFLRKEKVYEFVKDVKGPQATITFLKNIENLSNLYVATFFRDHDQWKSYPDAMLSAIDTNNFFNIAPFRSVLLAITAKFPPKEALQAFNMFVSLGVRLLIAASTRSGSIEETMAPAANKIFKGIITTTAELKAEVSGIIPTDREFQEAFEVAAVSKSAIARYYLRSLENVIQKQKDPHYIVESDKEEITLEHVLPEHPLNNWPQFTPEEHETSWKRLGNMVLLRNKLNSDLKSESFPVKIQEYKCSYELTKQVMREKGWTTDKIRERQSGLAKWALKAWPI